MKMNAKRLTAIVSAVLLCLLAMTGCAESPPVAEKPSGDTPAAAARKVMLVVSFGTSYNDNRDLSIGGIEGALQAAYPDYEVRRAFTSQIIIDKLKDRDSITIDTVREAMDRLVADGVTDVVIQPTHVMEGYEYDDIISEVSPYADKFDSFRTGSSLLNADEDYSRLAAVITDETKQYDTDGTAIVFMGHGTEHKANATYARLQQAVADAGYDNYFIGTVEAEPSLDDMIDMAKASGAAKVVLLPLMIVAGDHANNDMAGNEEDSWKTRFEAAGFEVECVLTGMGQYEGVQQMVVDHAGRTIASASGVPDAGESPLPARIKDGTYKIEVDSSSSMFKIVDAQLTVDTGIMTAVLTLGGDGYEKLYMGTGEQALADTDDKCVYYVEDAEGKYTYTVPVAALDRDIDCAAWSINKQQWYDRVLVFKSGLIPEDAFIN